MKQIINKRSLESKQLHVNATNCFIVIRQEKSKQYLQNEFL